MDGLVEGVSDIWTMAGASKERCEGDVSLSLGEAE